MRTDSEYFAATSLRGGTGNANYKTHSTIHNRAEPSRANKPIYLIKLKFIALRIAVARQTDTIHAKWFINSRPSIIRGRGSIATGYLAFIPRNLLRTMRVLCRDAE